jgi:hypothetical protein
LFADQTESIADRMIDFQPSDPPDASARARSSTECRSH